jgi:NTP pyrophosphatase (non-canonical NTP hydrolase)
MNDLIIEWANQRGLLKPENVNKQFLKLAEEVGELASAIAKGDGDAQVDAIGDIQVVLIILSNQLGYNAEACLECAYGTIKNRTGKTVGGVFIKD